MSMDTMNKWQRAIDEEMVMTRLGVANDDDDLRDRFAAHALAGYLAAFSGPDVSMPDPVSAAVAAYGYAEAMLAERESSRIDAMIAELETYC